MRKTLLFLLLLCTKLTFAQLNDNFTDGDFSNNPVWGGSTSLFSINASKQLQTVTSATAQTVYLSTANQYALNTVWEFYVQMNFDPSSSNATRIYLTSNRQDLKAADLSGYYIQIGESGSTDSYDLFRVTNGGTAVKIIDGPAKTRANANVLMAKVRVTRDSNGKWELYTDITGGTNYTLEGTVTDVTHTTTSWFGVWCDYTATRSNGFIFDDFNITELVADVTPPKVTAIKSIDTKTLEVTFDEPLNTASAQNIANYSLSNGAGSPLTAVMGSTSNVVNLTYANNFVSGNYILTVSNVADVKGNAVVTPIATSFIYVEPYTAKRGDVVINEIMAAPISTATALNKEYIELYNTTDKYIIITGWKYKDATTSVTTLGADTLAPKSYRILSAVADVDAFKVYGKTLGVSPWPSLNNDKDDLSLMLADNTIIDAVSYADTWYRDNTKKTGYALELINPTGTCGGAFNWTASTGANNGTPGAQNSVYNPQHTDNVAPKLLSAAILSTTQIQVDFDKVIASTMLTDVNNYSINNGIGKPTLAELNGTNNTSVKLTLANAIAPNTENLLTVSNLSNCAGIPIDPAANTAIILLPDQINAGDILISEILFNPKTGGFDFVELYNPTNKVFDLKELTISNPTGTGTTGPTKRTISNTSVFIKPKTYWVLTANPLVVQQQYQVKYPSQMVQIASMPSYNNDKGTVAIWKGETAVDQFDYTEKMHHALLKDVKGVSLERVSFTISGNEPGNLQSAASSVGFATPTDKNSQSEDTSVKNSVVVANKTFSPDNDGFEDLLQIDYRFKENGNLATINIYTDKGVLVRRLARNITFSTQGTITWDGLDDSGQLCKVGLYVIKADIFTIRGSADSFKQTCVLASKLN